MQNQTRRDPNEVLAKGTKSLSDLRTHVRTYAALRQRTSNPAVLLASLDKLGKLLETVRSDLQMAEVADWLAQERESLAKGQDEFRNHLASELPKLLGPDDFKIRGTFPKLYARFYTLVLDFNSNSAFVWYGPEDTLLAKVALDARAIADALREEHRKLTERSMSQSRFLELLHKAYVLVSAQNKTDKVPLSQVLPLMSIFAQETEFLNDPTRERYRSYGRAQFSYDIYKANGKTVGGKQIELDTATMSQSKKKSDYLWVPSNDQGDGHIKSTISFRESK